MKRLVIPSAAVWMMLPFFFFLICCSPLKQPTPRIEYYTLEYDPPEHPELPPLPVILRIQRFTTASSYNTLQMVYRDRSFRRGTYAYHRWHADPADLIADRLARDMRHSGLFRAVVQDESTLASTHVLEGSLDEFFEWSDEAGWKAVLSITATLITARESDITRKVLFQKTFRAVRPCKEKTPRGLAEAMSQAMADVSEEMIKAVHDRLSMLNDRKGFS
jgi:ABC-type uncharacterized transport system auxiliary subunit